MLYYSKDRSMSRTIYMSVVRFSKQASPRSFVLVTVVCFCFVLFFSVNLSQMASKCTFSSEADVHKAQFSILVDESVDGELPLKPACCDSNQRHSKAQ